MADKEQDRPEHKTLKARLTRLSGQDEYGRSGVRVFKDKLFEAEGLPFYLLFMGGAMGTIFGGLFGAASTDSNNEAQYREVAAVESAAHLDRDFSDDVAYHIINSRYDGGSYLLVQEGDKYQLYKGSGETRWSFVSDPREASLMMEEIADTYEKMLREYEEDSSGQTQTEGLTPLQMKFLPDTYSATRLSEAFNEGGEQISRIVRGTSKDTIPPTVLKAELTKQHERWKSAFEAVENGEYGLVEGQVETISEDDIPQGSLLVGAIKGAGLGLGAAFALSGGIAMFPTGAALYRGRRRRQYNKQNGRRNTYG